VRRGFIFAIGLATALTNAAAHAQDARRFDGVWSVVLACPKSPEGALPTFRFAAMVTNGTLHGVNGVAGRPGWMTLDGQIRPDGAAALDADGLTGNAAYNVNQAQRGVPYHHAMAAHFDATRGAGQWTTTRVCDFTFTRQ
jgi:hypothetical protein